MFVYLFYLAVTRQQKFYFPGGGILEINDNDDMDWKPNCGFKTLNPIQQQLDAEIPRPLYDLLKSIEDSSSIISIPSPQRKCTQNQPCQRDKPDEQNTSKMFFNYVSSVVELMPSIHALQVQKEISDVLVKYQIDMIKYFNKDISTTIDIEVDDETDDDS